jgi:transposase-like protein
MTIAQHHGRPGTPTDQAHVESFFSHLKGDWPHLTTITDAGALDAELARVRREYNTIRLHAGIGYVTPDDEHQGRGPEIRRARIAWGIYLTQVGSWSAATGKDYPGSYAELLAWFPDEPACLDYLEWLRWPDGFRCPRCVSRTGWRLSSGRWECAVCGRQASVTAGTIFHRTRTPLRLWFAAAWQMTSQKHGVSALGLQRALGLGSYQTAWAMLHRYRAAMVRPGRERLSGLVEVDETFVGGHEEGRPGRAAETKSLVAIAVEIKQPTGFGRVRMQRVDAIRNEFLIPFITGAVEPGATVHTDGNQSYWSLPDRGYEHDRTVMSQQNDPAHVVMPGVHRIASLLKRWLLGTHQGSVGPDHLDAYLNEFTFRFNRRGSRRRGLLFYRLLEQAILAEPITYRSLIVNPRPGRPRPTLPKRSPPSPAVPRPWRSPT